MLEIFFYFDLDNILVCKFVFKWFCLLF